MAEPTRFTDFLDYLIGSLIAIYLGARIASCLAGCGWEEPNRDDIWRRPDMFLLDQHHHKIDNHLIICGDNICEYPETIMTCSNDCLPQAQKPPVSKVRDPGYIDPVWR